MNSAVSLDRHQKNYVGMQVEILSHYANKDAIYSTVPQLSRKSVNFIRKAYSRLEDNETYRI